MADDLDLSDAVLARALGRMTPATKQKRPDEGREPSPTLLAILGSIADGASTYALMKKGHSEDNPMFNAMAGRPAATGAAVAGTGLAGVGLSKLLGRKFPAAARALTANHAAQTIGLAGKNFEQTQSGWFGESSTDAYRKAVMSALRQDKTR